MSKSRHNFVKVKLTKNADGAMTVNKTDAPGNGCRVVHITNLGNHGLPFRKKTGSVTALSRGQGTLLRPGAKVFLTKEGVTVSNDGGTIYIEPC